MKTSMFILFMIVIPIIILIPLVYISIVLENDNLKLLANIIFGFSIGMIILRLFKKK